MKTRHFVIASAVAATLASAGAAAQTESRSWLPMTTNGYVGLSGGRADFDRECLRNFSCDQTDSAWKVYTGGKFRDIIGAELGYVDLGKVQYGFGDERARGVNLSGIANVPVGGKVGLFGKIGSTYSWTESSLNVAGGRQGKERGFGLSYGAGVDVNFTPNVGLRAEWERQRFHFVGGKSDIDALMVGARFMF